MSKNKEKLIIDLGNLYFLLRDHSYVAQANALKKVLFFIENEDKGKFHELLSLSIIWGGAGSLRDIDFGNFKDNEQKEKTLDKLKAYLKSNAKRSNSWF